MKRDHVVLALEVDVMNPSRRLLDEGLSLHHLCVAVARHKGELHHSRACPAEAVAVELHVAPVEGREQMVVHQRHLVEGRRAELAEHGHGLAVARQRAHLHLPVSAGGLDVLEGEARIAFAHIARMLAATDGVHRGHHDEQPVLLQRVDHEARVDVHLLPLQILPERLGIGIDALKQHAVTCRDVLLCRTGANCQPRQHEGPYNAADVHFRRLNYKIFCTYHQLRLDFF